MFLFGVAIFFELVQPIAPTVATTAPENQLSAANISVSTSTNTAFDATTSTNTVASSTQASPASTASLTVAVAKKSNTGAINSTSASSSGQAQIERIENPYTTPAETFDQVNTDARNALVNILCEPGNESSLSPISGSGVIIDPRGIILTNAHVAQYVLLSESPEVDLQCYIRTGSPATAEWSAAVLYIPPIWVDEHADEINELHPTGTGEHDYALLYITGSASDRQLPSQFPYLPFDTRPAIGFPGDQVLVASYPAELVGGIAAQYDLYADTTVTTIKQLLTFGTDTPDVVSLGGIIEAQEGSSGGAVVNQWGRLIALIATTSDGTTTSDRDLRGDSLSYINADLLAQTGSDLSTFLQGDPTSQLEDFTRNTAPGLIQLYIQQLSPAQ